jgi:hypothetical protein
MKLLIEVELEQVDAEVYPSSPDDVGQALGQEIADRVEEFEVDRYGDDEASDARGREDGKTTYRVVGEPGLVYVVCE